MRYTKHILLFLAVQFSLINRKVQFPTGNSREHFPEFPEIREHTGPKKCLASSYFWTPYIPTSELDL